MFTVTQNCTILFLLIVLPYIFIHIPTIFQFYRTKIMIMNIISWMQYKHI